MMTERLTQFLFELFIVCGWFYVLELIVSVLEQDSVRTHKKLDQADRFVLYIALVLAYVLYHADI